MDKRDDSGKREKGLTMIIVPILQIKNEEIWIERILTALVNVFPHVIVADTGSTDSTLEQVRKVDRVQLMVYENMTPAEVGQCRGYMQDVAKQLFHATHVFLNDGDEIYPKKYLEFIRDNPMPENAMSGFTYGIECTELDNGECWLLGMNGNLVGVSRQAVFSVDSKWSGVYPFESPDTFIAGHPTNHYWQSVDPSHHFFHIHQMRRSSKDEDVHMRMRKKYQFSMRDAPEIVPTQFWLKSQEDYRDE